MVAILEVLSRTSLLKLLLPFPSTVTLTMSSPPTRMSPLERLCPLGHLVRALTNPRTVLPLCLPSHRLFCQPRHLCLRHFLLSVTTVTTTVPHPCTWIRSIRRWGFPLELEYSHSNACSLSNVPPMIGVRHLRGKSWPVRANRSRPSRACWPPFPLLAPVRAARLPRLLRPHQLLPAPVRVARLPRLLRPHRLLSLLPQISIGLVCSAP